MTNSDHDQFSCYYDQIIILTFKGNFTAEADVAKEDFEASSKAKLLSVLEVLPGMSRSYLKCDPKQHKEKETFLAVKGFLQVLFYAFLNSL